MADSQNRSKSRPKFYGFALLAGAVGGSLPSVARLSFSSVESIAGALFGTALFMFFGALVVFFYQEDSMKRALAIGASLPGILQGISGAGNVAADNAGAAALSFATPIATQSSAPPRRLTFVFRNKEADEKSRKQEKSAHPQSKTVWFSTTDNSPLPYRHGLTTDTIFVEVPAKTQELTIAPGNYGKEYGLVVSGDKLKQPVIHLQFVGNGFWRSFWQATGNDRVPKFKIEFAEAN